ncbi:MAG: VWA domain-containing protein [Elusimicrobia bacterium]|nr:VWA domain-containing protein [Elusimicrobiota bacterium]
MINFASPIFFLLIPFLVILVIYIRIRDNNRRQSLLNFPQYILVRDINKSKKIKLYMITRLITYTILLLFVIALARPQIGNKTENVLNQGTDIIMALDVSTSMEALDFEPVNRLEAAKKVAIDFVNSRQFDRIGIVLFSGLAFTQVPLTNDKQTAIRLLSFATTGMTSVDGTAIGSAIVTACNRLKDSEADGKIIILITDGANNIGEVDPITAAEIAKSLNIKIYTIGAGAPDGAYYRVMDPVEGMKMVKVVEQELDEKTLKRIADITDGQYFRANNTKMLQDVIKQIDKIEKTDVNSIKFDSYHEIYDIFVWIILFLMLLNIFFNNILFRKLI